jgi:hypothetical protein
MFLFSNRSEKSLEHGQNLVEIIKGQKFGGVEGDMDNSRWNYIFRFIGCRGMIIRTFSPKVLRTFPCIIPEIDPPTGILLREVPELRKKSQLQWPHFWV